MTQLVSRKAPPTPGRARRFAAVRREGLPWLMLAPALAILAGFIIYPAVNAIYLSLTSTNLLNISAQTFVGFDNFVRIFQRPDFWESLRNSALWTFGNVAFQLVLGMIGALILNAKFTGRGVIRGIVLLPWATPSVLVALMWLWILDPNLGIVNHLLRAVGITSSPIAFLADQHTALPTLMFIDIWQGIPFFAVMILAALQGVSGELIEAARIDGANAWKTFWQVVLPLIMPTVLITVILRLIWTANYFDLILVLTNGGPANASLTLPLNAYITAYKGTDLGGGAALGVIQALLLAVLVVFYMRQIRKSELA
jgi:multiple sugar transport system permease protein